MSEVLLLPILCRAASSAALSHTNVDVVNRGRGHCIEMPMFSLTLPHKALRLLQMLILHQTWKSVMICLHVCKDAL